MFRPLFFLSVFSLFFTSYASAATFTVTNADDSGPGSFRQALTDANALAGADTIDFAIPTANPGGSTINLSSALPDITGDLTISGPGMDLLTLNRNSATNFRIFLVSAGTNVVISGITLQNGLAPVIPDSEYPKAYGGGIHNSGDLTINGCRITGNGAYTAITAGGGIYSTGRLTMTGSIVSNNGVAQHIAGCELCSSKGSGIFAGGTTTLTDVSITGNTYSGAVYNVGTMTAKRANIFANNTTGMVSVGNMSIADSSIYQNSPIQFKDTFTVGGIQLGYWPITYWSASIVNTTISENTGAAILASYGTSLHIDSSTIVGNGSTGISVSMIQNAPRITNSIVAANLNSADLSGSFDPAGSYNLIGNGGGTMFQNGVNGNIVGTGAAPIDPQVSGLNYFGGEMPVNMPLSTSPVINAGSPVLSIDHDERGVVRPVGVRQDIGAVEFNLTPNRYLPQGAVGTAFDQTFQAFGLPGYSNFQFSISAGSLPPGMTLQNLGSNAAKIAGTPSTTGTFSFTVLATDTVEYTVSANYSITVLPAGSISFVPVQGRVTRPDGRPVRNAFVQAIDSNGQVAAESLTNPFGFFHFASLQNFAPYTFAIRHKTLAAAAPTITMTANMADISIVTQ